MVLILLTWLVLTFISFTIGFAVRKFFVPLGNSSEIAITIIWGLFTISVTSALFLFFIPAGGLLLMLFILWATVVQFFSREETGKRLNLFRITIAGRREIIFGSLLLFGLLMFSAQSSKINDDGHYYTQTVMWLAQEGFVNGISNLHLPLGLGSSWHILQALFSFDFIEGMRFNDLNGFLVFVFFIYCLENGFHEKQNLLLALLLAVTLVISVPFLSAASPDLPVIIFSVIAFYMISGPFGSRTVVDVLLLAAFAASIKFSAVALVLLGGAMIAYVLVKRIPVPDTIYFLLFLTGAIIVSKNIYQTGYPFYPYPWLGISDLSWATPQDLLQHYTAGIKYWGPEGKMYKGPMSEWKNPGIAATVQLLLERKGLTGIIHTILLAGFPVIFLTLLSDVYQKAKAGAAFMPIVVLHAIFVVNFFLWLAFAPQYRFILPVYVFYVPWCVWRWTKPLIEKRIRYRVQLLPLMTIAVLFLVSLIPISFEIRSTSRHLARNDGFSFNTLFKPHVSYTFPGLDSLSAGGQQYYHVKRNIYCWDSPLPCMSESYYRFLQDQGYEIFGAADRREFVLRTVGSGGVEE